jgi:hypothetical protein
MTWTKLSAPSAGTSRYRLLLALTSVEDPWTATAVSGGTWTQSTLTGPASRYHLLLALTSNPEPWTKATTPS